LVVGEAQERTKLNRRDVQNAVARRERRLGGGKKLLREVVVERLLLLEREPPLRFRFQQASSWCGSAIKNKPPA